MPRYSRRYSRSRRRPRRSIVVHHHPSRHVVLHHHRPLVGHQALLGYSVPHHTVYQPSSLLRRVSHRFPVISRRVLLH